MTIKSLFILLLLQHAFSCQIKTNKTSIASVTGTPPGYVPGQLPVIAGTSFSQALDYTSLTNMYSSSRQDVLYFITKQHSKRIPHLQL